ncbi:E3 ubiquitin-protein ligase WAV3-like [Phoenix dactylifera]|uniref:E3 ubiquitin-protein ligase WAV3-like n=1 Tax=Phoenix dactylifera TaxID=42345 RepID=A0A8B7C9P5_PHODC|nr:E3 ubiquitin-protein ligase WAV3-like [Phoenix dactylifera]
MGGGASRWRRAAKRIGFPCASFSVDATPTTRRPSKTISCSAVSVTGDKTEEKPEESGPTAVSDKSLCAICLEPLSSGGGGGGGGGDDSGGQAIFTAQCMHAFHFVCIASNVRHGSVTCPICRAHWSQLPRDLTIPSSHHADPIIRILDDSIATSRINRRSSIRTTRYDDDDPIDPDTVAESTHPRLLFALIAAPVPCSHGLHAHSPCGHLMSLHHQYHFTSPSTSVLVPPGTSPCKQKRVYLSVKLSHQRATDLVLVASPNGPHLRLLKQSMALVVFSLRAVDRLAIVTNSAAATRAFPLRRMTSHGKRSALQVIDRLYYLGEADPDEGLRKGIRILEDRAHQNPLSCILHLSDSPTRANDLQVNVPIHRFHVGLGFGMSNGFVMHEFEEFLVRLLGGAIRETQVRIGGEGGVVRLGELRGGEEKRIPLDLMRDCGFITVGYSFIEGGADERLKTGEVVVGIGEKSERSHVGCELGGRDLSIGGRRSSCVERWDYLDPFMARRWAKHLHGYKA